MLTTFLNKQEFVPSGQKVNSALYVEVIEDIEEHFPGGGHNFEQRGRGTVGSCCTTMLPPTPHWQ
jgi:hypothetical protein